MLLNTFLRHSAAFLFLLLAFWQTRAQYPDITVSSERKPLAGVLEEVTRNYGVKFAYDANSFHDIETRFSFEGIALEEFLRFLEKEYAVSSSLIDGTWVLVIQETRDSEPPVFAPPEPQLTRLSGFVRDKETGEDLEYCNVACEPNKGGMTNELGFFTFTLPHTDSVRLLVSYLGYRTMDTIVSPQNTVMILLEPSEIMLKPVRVVHTEREVLQASPLPEKIAFNPLKSSAVPRISNDDLGNALLLIPGVNFLQGASPGLSIRGGAPTDNLVLFDGIPVLETSHLLGNMSVLNAKFVQQAFVSRGGFDAGYGGRVSGLIELTGKSGKNNRPYLDVSANLLNSNVLANIPVTNKFSITAAWRRSFIDSWQNYLYYRLIENVSSTDENPVTSTIIPSIKYQDVNTKISFHPSAKMEFNLNLLYGKDRQSRDFELIQTNDYYRNERMKSGSLGMSLNWKWQVNDEWFHSFSAGFSSWEKDMVDETGELEEITEVIENPGKGQGKGKGLAKTRERTYSRQTHDIDNGFNHIEEYRAAWKTALKSGNFTHEAGVGLTYNSYAYDFFASRLKDTLQIDSIASSANQYLLNAFVQQNIDVTDQVRFRWGLRSSFDISRRKTFWQPRGGLEFLPVRGVKVYFLSGIYYQFLTGIRRFDSEGHFSPVWYLPDDKGQGTVSGTHYILGGKFEKDGWFIDLEAYLKNAEGKVNLFAEEVGLGEKISVTYNPHESRERNKGIDLFVQKKHFLFNHMLSYSIATAEEQTSGFFGNKWYPGYNDRTHRLKLTEMIRWKNWTLTGSWQVASGLPVVQYTRDSTTDEFARSDPFAQLDLALIKTFTGNFYSFSAGVSMLNVFDRKNIVEVNYLRFSSDAGSMTVRSDISALGFTPVFFINAKF
ncbi:TonB-dependent receptor [Mariniphaga sediminis]|uniref:TonB-dependent receptor n=1 Tax=Mariniphaga sediminis TaxID=1628158 RepID=UPI00356715E6